MSPPSPPTPTINLPLAVAPQHTLPPPYEAHESDGEQDDDEDSYTPKTTIHINASTNIRGHNNIVSSPTLDTSHLAAQITAAIRNHNYQLGLDVGPLNIRIDRSVSVVGDRNAIGNLTGGLGVAARGRVGQEVARRMAMAKQRGGANSAAGMKRKADDVDGEDVEREAKRAAMRRAESCPPS